MSEWGVKGVMVESSGAAEAVRAVSPSLPLYGSTGLNVFNHMTASVLGETFRLLTLSPELSASQMALLIRHMRTASCSPSLELIVQGPAEMVVSEDCLPLTVLGSAALEESGPGTWWGIRDEKNYTFPVVIDSERRTHILNPVELSLIDQLPLLFDTGCDGCAIDARWRTERYAREMSRLYSDAIGAVAAEGVDARKRLDSLKKKARDRSIGGITTGHFLRGLRDE
jgi:putative protease